MEDAKKLKLKEELESASSNLLLYPNGSDINEDEDFQQLLSKKLQYDPYQQSDPVLNFFGLGYNTKPDDDEYFSSDDDEEINGVLLVK